MCQVRSQVCFDRLVDEQGGPAHTQKPYRGQCVNDFRVLSKRRERGGRKLYKEQPCGGTAGVTLPPFVPVLLSNNVRTYSYLPRVQTCRQMIKLLKGLR